MEALLVPLSMSWSILIQIGWPILTEALSSSGLGKNDQLSFRKAEINRCANRLAMPRMIRSTDSWTFRRPSSSSARVESSMIRP